jgi:NADPH:quinone reductase-like Zn-dependent oxidoreductase
MQRIVIQRPGSYDRLTLVEQPTPRPAAGEVLVETAAVGVNYADCVVRMGLYSSAKKFVGWPITPGFEFSGTVSAVGDGVTQWEQGQRVLGLTLFGGYSSHVVVPQSQLFPMPEGWNFSRAAAFPTVHLTAWYALCELARPRPGLRVLVHSAAGGVGSAALAICRHRGMNAVGVVGASHKVAAALSAGANQVVDRSTQDLWAQARQLAPEGFDIILESSGVATLAGSYRALRPTGRLIIFGLASMLPKNGESVSWLKLAWEYWRTPRFSPIKMLDKNRTVSAFNLSYLFEQQELLQAAMTDLLSWAQEGALPAPPLTEYSLAEAGAAQASLETGQTVGKLVLIP